MAWFSSWAMRAFVAPLIVLVAACLGASKASSQIALTRAVERSGADVRLVPVPAAVVAACKKAQRQVRFTVLCPSLLPRPSRGSFPGLEPIALGAAAFKGGTIDIGYNAEGDTGGSPLSFNTPERFLHFEILSADQGIPQNARPASLGGRHGLLAPATPGSYAGPYFANHVRFLFRERGHLYAATLHTFGEQATERLLDRILRTLKPASELVSLRPAPMATSRIGVPTGPSTVTVDAGALWVVSHGTIQNLANHLLRIDPARQEVTPVRGLGVRTIEVAAGASAIWATHTHNTPDGQLAPPELARINPDTTRVTGRLALSQDRRDAATAITAGDDAIWVALTRFGKAGEPGALVRIDPSTLKPAARIPVGARPIALALDGPRLWVANARSNTVSVIDTDTNEVTATIRVGQWPSAIAVGSGSVWVASARDGTVSRIDSATSSVAATIPIGDPAYSLTVTGTAIWAALPGSGALLAIDPTTNTIARQTAVGGDPLGIAADGDSLWVTMNSDALVVRVPVSRVAKRASGTPVRRHQRSHHPDGSPSAGPCGEPEPCTGPASGCSSSPPRREPALVVVKEPKCDAVRAGRRAARTTGRRERERDRRVGLAARPERCRPQRSRPAGVARRRSPRSGRRRGSSQAGAGG